MDFSWVQGLLNLLFGQVGVLGTVLIMACAYIAWQLKLEQEDHKLTRDKNEVQTEKRLQMMEAYLKAISEVKVSLDTLSQLVNRKRSV